MDKLRKMQTKKMHHEPAISEHDSFSSLEIYEESPKAKKAIVVEQQEMNYKANLLIDK